MAFKMKGGKDPMKKNFPDLTGDDEVTQADILKGRGVFKMKKDNAPMMRMDNSAMKAMGSPNKIDLNFRGGKEAAEDRAGTAKRDFLKNWETLSDEQKRNVPDKFVKMYGVTKPKNPAKGQLGGLNENAQK